MVAPKRRLMTVLVRARRRIQKLGPYQSLILVLLPTLLVEPLKLVAVYVAGEGHWLSGTGIMIAAYAVSLLVVERLFTLAKPKLMTIGWFATFWIWYTNVRRKTWTWFRCAMTKRRVLPVCDR